MSSYMDSNPFPRGSEWRKWDLHVHAPGGKLADGYGDSDEVWERFCAEIAGSDVDVIGITDYFSLRTFFKCRRIYGELHPETPKTFFPNIEMRLTESVNRDGEPVEMHIILDRELDEERGKTLLANLMTEVQEGERRRGLPCSELKAPDFKAASISREKIQEGLERTFGEERPGDPRDYMLIVPANRGGLRADPADSRRVEIALRVEEFAHGVFGTEGNVQHFHSPARIPGHVLPPKPVFAGSDAHSMDQLQAWLGREVREEANRKSITWVKADPNLEGLLQTKAEPEGRVKIQATEPDQKEPYKRIAAVSFSGTDAFPKRIEFNSNLVAIIGSRSAGKSSLLAYVANAVDEEETRVKQLSVLPQPRERDLGPAPGVTWAQVENITVDVEWGEGGVSSGRVIYVPQNSLYAISQEPKKVREKIEPTLWRLDRTLKAAHDRMRAEVDGANEAIRGAVGAWARAGEAIDSRTAAMNGFGEPAAITERREELSRRITELREQTQLSEAEADRYEAVMKEISLKEARLAVVGEEIQVLAAYISPSPEGGYEVTPVPKADIRLSPPPEEFPDELRGKVVALIEKAEGDLGELVAGAMVDHQSAAEEEAKRLGDEAKELRDTNKSLIEKSETNKEIEELSASKRKQEEALAGIEAEKKAISGLGDERSTALEKIGVQRDQREEAIGRFVTAFGEEERRSGDLEFKLEIGFDDELFETLSGRLNRQSKGGFISKDSNLIDLERAQAEPSGFLEELDSEVQRVRQGHTVEEVAADVLVATREVRPLAELDGDRIGGFKSSSMTPGKQALFALTLIMEESEEGWPLLIDQPEDDLDSRSIAQDLVGYLIKRKGERQIIMVSHDANLVVGADAEQVIVANRHGDDNPNKDERYFDYFSGSLEHTRARRPDAHYVLEKGGIREHACDILDGGEEAFRKRRDKYRIR